MGKALIVILLMAWPTWAGVYEVKQGVGDKCWNPLTEKSSPCWQVINTDGDDLVDNCSSKSTCDDLAFALNKAHEDRERDKLQKLFKFPDEEHCYKRDCNTCCVDDNGNTACTLLFCSKIKTPLPLINVPEMEMKISSTSVYVTPSDEYEPCTEKGCRE